MDATANLLLPYIAPQQAQKHVTVNETFRKLDALVQTAVVSATTTAQPGSPADGDVYILPVGKTGAAWGSMSNLALAYYVDGAWMQISPREGFQAWVKDTDAFVLYNGSAWNALAGGGGGGREVLTADRTYFVRTDGNDSNTGLADTAGGAFLTHQRAVDAASAIDSGIYDVYIDCTQVGPTFDVGPGIKAKKLLGVGRVFIRFTGSGATLNCSGVMAGIADGLLRSAGVPTPYSLYGPVTLTSSATGTAHGLHSTNAGQILFKDVTFGSGFTAQQIRSSDGGYVEAVGNYAISGGSNIHVAALSGGIVRIQGRRVTLTGTPAISVYANNNVLGASFLNSCVFSGAATGARYSVGGNAVIFTSGGGASYLPGDSAGSSSTGGQYT